MKHTSKILKRSFSAQTKTSYGFIGLGQMGSRMANNLLTKSKAPLTVFDTYAPSTESLSKQGATVVSSVAEVAQNSDIIVTMLRNGDQVKSVLTEMQKNVRNNALIIDSSTINFKDWQSITSNFKSNTTASNINLVDAPVSGGIGAAQAGTLAFLVGGSKDAFIKAKSVLEYMGTESKIFHCGENDGDGQIAKCCNNLLLAISMEGVSEAMNLGIKLGMDAKTLANVINNSSGRCWSSDTYNPVPNVIETVPSSNQYNGGFVVNLMRKDLNLALNAANEANASTPIGSSVKQIYDMIGQRGFDEKDFGFIYQYIKGSETDNKYT